MTPEQSKQLADVRSLVERMRNGGQSDAIIRAGLIREGWPAAAVIEAMDAARDAPMTKPGNKEYDT